MLENQALIHSSRIKSGAKYLYDEVESGQKYHLTRDHSKTKSGVPTSAPLSTSSKPDLFMKPDRWIKNGFEYEPYREAHLHWIKNDFRVVSICRQDYSNSNFIRN